MVSKQDTSTMQQRWSLQANPLRTDIRWLFQSALIVFIVTVGIGILNGQHITTLSQDVLLTHVHAGTLGWITLSVFAMGFWLFGVGEGNEPTEKNLYVRTLSILSAISIPVYVLAFLSGNLIARAVFSFPVLLAIIGFLGWIIARIGKIRLGVAHLAVLGSIITLIVGSVIGVLLQIEFATNTTFLPAGAFAAHPATQVVGYLILIGMALSEWRLMPDTGRLPRAGVVQITLPFIAGFILTIGLLLNIMPLLGLNAVLEVIAVIIYIVRFAPRFAQINWLGRNSDRFFAVSGLFLVVNVVLLTYLIVTLITGFYKAFPPDLLIALDHTMFVGVMTNALFGLIQDASYERRSFWPWADDILFWGMNIGVTGFIATLIITGLGTDVRVLEKVFTPIMGISILLAILTYFIRLSRPPAPEMVEVKASAS